LSKNENIKSLNPLFTSLRKYVTTKVDSYILKKTVDVAKIMPIVRINIVISAFLILWN